MSDRPTVVCIVLDTVRAQSLTSAFTPTIDGILDRAVRFERAVAPSPWTAPSHAAMFTGLTTAEHGVNCVNQRFDPPVEPLPALFQNAGYHTIGVSNNPYISREFGFDVGFDDFHDNPRFLYDDGLDLGTIAEGRALKYADTARRVLTHDNPKKSIANVGYHLQQPADNGADLSVERATRSAGESNPEFLFVNLMEAHAEYWPPQPYRRKHLAGDITDSAARDVEQFHWAYLLGDEQPTDGKCQILRSLYRGAIAYLDSIVTRLRSEVYTDEEWKNTFLIILGDHGESFGEHGYFNHIGHVTQQTLHVPLIIAPPDGWWQSRSVETPVSLRLLYDICEAIAAGDGRSALERGLDSQVPPVAEYTGLQNDIDHLAETYNVPESELARYDQARQATIVGKYIYVRNGKTADVVYRWGDTDSTYTPESVPDVTARARKRLEDRLGPVEGYDLGERSTVGSATENRLEYLGYR
ncbi:sulfatase-like hydrolase/transferase [Haloarcula pelagica]|uniref:sulfatase-like hydrolase/transferase n=1 Tax=Haloarcula pelagica TaxID=3033389 RepID=UPI0024C291ED|nr:sulfatase-like hydrolase/transferase [Halomicroarcula sp. YJ-61-S]